MKKLFLKFLPIMFVVAFASIVLSGCENFLEGNELRNYLSEDLKYINAKSVSIIVKSEEGTGTVIPSGNITVKQGYQFEVSFTEAAEWSFIKWQAVSADNSEEIIEDVQFSDPESSKTFCTVNSLAGNIRIIPVCSNRISVTEVNPKYMDNGVSRDRSITIQFSKKPDPSSFIFSENEIPSGADIITDAQSGEIYAYKQEGMILLKNIKIESNGLSIAGHFTKPSLEGNILTIALNKTNPLEFSTNEEYKIIKVTVSANVCDEYKISMSQEKTWNYKIIEETDAKATVNITCENNEGSVYLAGIKDWSMDQKITLAFTESADYQFVRWDFDSSYVAVAEPENKSTYAIVLNKTENEITQIKAVCEPRLRIVSFSPVSNNTSDVFSKNTSIAIEFNKSIPVSDADLKQLDNILIMVGGNPVNTSFLTPVVNDNTITFVADKTNYIDVHEGAKKTVTVTVPEDFYYLNDDGLKITYGGNGKTFSYVIDSSTTQKAQIQFTCIENSGELVPETGLKQYSIGNKIPLSFTPAEGYIFNGWSITDINGNAVSNNQLTIENSGSASTVLWVNDVTETSPVFVVKALTSQILSVISMTPSAEVNCKDSDIVITFNKPLDSACAGMLNKINVSTSGKSLDSCYNTRSLSSDRKKITLKNTELLSVPKGEYWYIDVTIPSDFYYFDGDLKIKLEGTSRRFRVDYKTNTKLTVNYGILNGENDTAFPSAGTVNPDSYKEYYLGEEIEILFTPNDGYQFYGWRIKDSNGNDVPSSVISFKTGNASSKTATLLTKAAASNLKINAVCYKRPVVSLSSVSPYNVDSATEFAKNTPIEITFDHAISPDTRDNIVITYTVANFSKTAYYTSSISSDNKIVTFTPIQMLPLNNSYEKVTVTIPCDMVYYYAKDGKTIIKPESDFSWFYRVNRSTIKKTILRVDSSDAYSSSVTVNKLLVSSGASQDINVEEILEFEYPLTDGYKFSGWKLTAASSGYTVEPTGYTTSGSIVVKSGSEDFLTLTIDNNNPLKAYVVSNESIQNGANGWGVTVSAKDVLLPKVSSVTPAYYSSGTECDTPVTVSFNKAVTKSSVTFSSSGTIQIVDPNNENQHYEQYFNTPVWSGNTVTIKPKNTIRNLFSNEDDLINFKVKINYSSIKDLNDNSLQSDPSWIYRINYGMESIAPSVTMNVFKPQYNPTEVSGSYTTLSNYAYSGWSSTNYSTNHVNKKVYFDYSVSDSGSGFKQMTLKETLVKTVTGTTVSVTGNPHIYTSASATKQLYNIESDADGIIKLDFAFEDYAGNIALKTYYVVKDTTLDATSVLNPALTDFTAAREGVVAERGDLAGQDVFSRMGALECYYKKLTDTGVASFNARNTESSTSVTEILDFSSNNDVFYSPNDYGKAAASYAIKYGYSESSITNSATKQTQTKYTFTRDSTKNCYVRITAYDAVGNTDSIVRIFPKQASIVSMPSATSTYTYNTITVSNKDELAALAKNASAVKSNYLYVYKFKPKGSSSFSSDIRVAPAGQGKSYDDGVYSSTGDLFYLSNKSFTDSTLTPDGTYYFYVIPYIEYSERKYFGAASKTPYVFYHNVTAPTSSSTPSFPAYTISVGSAVKSAGIRSVSTTLNSSTTSGFTYGIRYNATGTTDYKYADLSFNVPSGTTYDVYLYARNNTTNQIHVGSTKKTVDATYDNVPPYLKYAQDAKSLSVNPNQLTLVSGESMAYPADDGVGLKTDSNGYGTFKYYLIKKNDETVYSKIERSDLTGLTARTASFSGTSVQLPFDCFIDSVYILVFDLEDKNGNQGLYSYTVSNHIVPKKTYLSYSSTYSRLSINGASAGGYNINAFRGYSLLNGVWKYKYRDNYSSNSSDNTFVKFRGQGSNTISTGNYTPSGYTLYCFYSTDFLNSWRSSGVQPSLSTKVMMPAYGNSFLVYYDSPCLVLTMAYPTDKLSELESTINSAVTNGLARENAVPDVWATKAMEYGPKVFYCALNSTERSSTYTVPISEIPAGYSYCVITYFADGTSVMSDIRQK